MKRLYRFKTKVGVFYIAEYKGTFHPVFDDTDLGSYATPAQAAEDLAGGHTFSIPGGVDPTRLNIPDDLGRWEKI